MYEVPDWIDGLTVSDVASHLAQHGLNCEGPSPRGETMRSWECKAPSDAEGIEREVSIIGQDPDRIRLVTATVSRDDEAPPEEAAADFLGYVASLSYEGANPAQARRWVAENVTSGGKLPMGAAIFELYSEKRAWVLRIVAAGEQLG